MNTDMKEKAHRFRIENAKFVPDNQSEIMLEKSFIAGWEEYAKAYAPVPTNEDYEGAGKILYPLELQQIILDYKAWLESMILHVKKSIRPQINEKIKDLDKYNFAAPVPGKEEAAWKLCDSVQALFDMKKKKGSVHAMKVGWNIVSGDLFDLKKTLSASPSTASNEDKFIWTDELVKNYAECYRFSSSRISIEQFKKTGGYTQKVVNENYDANIKEVEPKAVQQAAKEYATHIVKGPKPWEQFDRIKYKAFLAGASFNKDAVEFAEWIDENGYECILHNGSVKIWEGMKSTSAKNYTTQELYNLFKQIGQ